jgi:hypothetical protein
MLSGRPQHTHTHTHTHTHQASERAGTARDEERAGFTISLRMRSCFPVTGLTELVPGPGLAPRKSYLEIRRKFRFASTWGDSLALESMVQEVMGDH